MAKTYIDKSGAYDTMRVLAIGAIGLLLAKKFVKKKEVTQNTASNTGTNGIGKCDYQI